MRDEGKAQAVGKWGYSQREVADYLSLHYSTLSRLMKEMEKSTNKTPFSFSLSYKLLPIIYGFCIITDQLRQSIRFSFITICFFG